jgi:hypothetical protein
MLKHDCLFCTYSIFVGGRNMFDLFGFAFFFLTYMYESRKRGEKKRAGVTEGSLTPVSTCGREVRAGRWQMRGGGLGNDKSALGGSGGPAEEQVTATAV